MGHSVIPNYARWLVPLAAIAACSSLGCASATVRRFPLRPPMQRDTDLRSISMRCRAEPSKDDPQHKVCTPEPYVSSFAWDAADNTLFRPLTRVFAVDPGGEAVNVNALDEVPDSSGSRTASAPNGPRSKSCGWARARTSSIPPSATARG